MKNKRLILIFLSLLISLVPVFAFAEDGKEGKGDGSGNGVNKVIRLTLSSSLPTEGSTEISTMPIIELTFNKNVCNVSVAASNKEAIHLTASTGEVIPITVIFPDDQVQRTYKREIFIRPDAPLAENTTYRIAVDNTLKGKNENLIDNAHVVSFTTGTSTATALSENEKLTALSENVISYHTALAETENSVPLTKEELLDGRQEEGISLQAIALIAVLAIVLIAALFTVIALKKRKSQPKQAD